jgi:hypothetical protein
VKPVGGHSLHSPYTFCIRERELSKAPHKLLTGTMADDNYYAMAGCSSIINGTNWKRIASESKAAG